MEQDHGHQRPRVGHHEKGDRRTAGSHDIDQATEEDVPRKEPNPLQRHPVVAVEHQRLVPVAIPGQ